MIRTADEIRHLRNALFVLERELQAVELKVIIEVRGLGELTRTIRDQKDILDDLADWALRLKGEIASVKSKLEEVA